MSVCAASFNSITIACQRSHTGSPHACQQAEKELCLRSAASVHNNEHVIVDRAKRESHECAHWLSNENAKKLIFFVSLKS